MHSEGLRRLVPKVNKARRNCHRKPVLLNRALAATVEMSEKSTDNRYKEAAAALRPLVSHEVNSTRGWESSTI